MKIIIEESSHPTPNHDGTVVNFSILGERKENSLEFPTWQKSITISDSEMVQIKTKEHLNFMKTQNALSVFEEYYNKVFNK